MLLGLIFTVFYTCGIVYAARELSSNRINLLPRANNYSGLSDSHDQEHSVYEGYQFRTNDYDDYSSGYDRQAKSQHLHASASSPKTPYKVHQPREDPRLFYQSDSYLQEVDGGHVNREVTFIYPGRGVNRATEEDDVQSMFLRVLDDTNIADTGSSVCIKCPHDKTLVARAGSDRVLLQAPHLFSCSGLRAPRHVHFIHMYGPKFGSFLQQGSHQIIGKVMHKKTHIQYCKMQVHVITQSCTTPEYLVSHCTKRNCTFSCKNRKSDLHGHSSLQCGSNNMWIGELPVCKGE